mmetsp:Transcript_44245/g.172272  ORF Transcript_44245/g.172272 Transcript_44245/m.172272 type:complete len:102 (-) Transcript_44245:534-839(-)
MNLSPRKVYRGNNLCRFSTRSPELLADNQQETADLVKKFPESLALDVEERCRKNVETLKTQYRMDDKRIRNAIKEQPFILGYELDCFGDCVGKCNQCWARF